ncbi:hypothetical protein C8J56DRAFT_181147 [Mycena floridula]|nr:hypothetical protein C8J56DRAFT_181147 [Mycena floridula]
MTGMTSLLQRWSFPIMHSSTVFTVLCLCLSVGYAYPTGLTPILERKLVNDHQLLQSRGWREFLRLKPKQKHQIDPFIITPVKPQPGFTADGTIIVKEPVPPRKKPQQPTKKPEETTQKRRRDPMVGQLVDESQGYGSTKSGGARLTSLRRMVVLSDQDNHRRDDKDPSNRYISRMRRW